MPVCWKGYFFDECILLFKQFFIFIAIEWKPFKRLNQILSNNKVLLLFSQFMIFKMVHKLNIILFKLLEFMLNDDINLVRAFLDELSKDFHYFL